MAYDIWHMAQRAYSGGQRPAQALTQFPSAIRPDDQVRFANMDGTSASLQYDRVRPGDPDEGPGPGSDMLHVRQTQKDNHCEVQFRPWRIIASSARVPNSRPLSK